MKAEGAMRAILIPVALVVSSWLPARAEELARPASMEKAAIPTYPLQAKRNEIEGKVVLRVHVGADGQVREIQVQSSSGSSLLDSAAVEAAKRSGFRAAHAASGSTVDSWVSIPYRFVLQ